MSEQKMREALQALYNKCLAGDFYADYDESCELLKVAREALASQAAQGEAVPAFWAAVTDDKIIEMSHSTDDGNGGLASRQEVNDWINENDPRMHLVGLYTAPQAPAVPDGWKLVQITSLRKWRDAFAEEIAAWDIDPPLHHVKTSHDEIEAMLADVPEVSRG